MRMRIGRWLLRAGVRLLGCTPARTVLFSGNGWTEQQAIEFIGRANNAARDAGQPLPDTVVVPWEIGAAYDAWLNTAGTPPRGS